MGLQRVGHNWGLTHTQQGYQKPNMGERLYRNHLGHYLWVPPFTYRNMQPCVLLGAWRSHWPSVRAEAHTALFSGLPGRCVPIFLPILIPFSLSSFCCFLLENFPRCVLEISDKEVLEWYTAKDFIVGKPLTILGRTFFIYDCDPFTRQYYREKFGVSDLPRIDMSKKEPPPMKQVMGHWLWG